MNILNVIDNIDNVSIDNEEFVLSSLMESYTKALDVIEEAEESSLDSFEIFNESFIMEAKKEEEKESTFRPVVDKKTGKKENILKSILMAIPRLIGLLIKKVKGLFSKDKLDASKKKETLGLIAYVDATKKSIMKNPDSEKSKKRKKIIIGISSGTVGASALAVLGKKVYDKIKKGDTDIEDVDEETLAFRELSDDKKQEQIAHNKAFEKHEAALKNNDNKEFDILVHKKDTLDKMLVCLENITNAIGVILRSKNGANDINKVQEQLTSISTNNKTYHDLDKSDKERHHYTAESAIRNNLFNDVIIPFHEERESIFDKFSNISESIMIYKDELFDEDDSKSVQDLMSPKAYALLSDAIRTLSTNVSSLTKETQSHYLAIGHIIKYYEAYQFMLNENK